MKTRIRPTPIIVAALIITTAAPLTFAGTLSDGLSARAEINVIKSFLLLLVQKQML